MNAHDTPRGEPAPDEGATTAQHGTPVPVDVSEPPWAPTTIALFVAGPVIWSVHFMVVYLAVEAGCTGDGPGLRVFDPPAPKVVTIIATVVAALACLAAAAWGHRRWRAVRSQVADGDGPVPADRGGSLAFAGLLLSLLGFVTVLFVGLPALVLPPC